MSTIEARTVQTVGAGPIILRGPVEADMPAWIQYELALFGADPHKVTERSEFDARPAAQWERLCELIERPGSLVIVASPAAEPGRIIGDLMFQGARPRKMEHHGHFGIAVADGDRGRGIGSAMIRVMLDWAARHPLIEKVALGVWATNTGAVRMYERAGFREEGRRLRYFKAAPGVYADDIQMAIWVKPGLAPAGFNTHTPAA